MQAKSFYTQWWFWLIIVGILLLGAGILLFFMKWVSNWISIALGAVGLVFVIGGIILAFVMSSKNKKTQEAERMRDQREQMVQQQQQQQELLQAQQQQAQQAQQQPQRAYY